MADKLTRRQGRGRIRQRHDVETGLRTEDDASHSDDDDSSHSGEAYGNSRCVKILSSYICAPSVQGRVLRLERHCCSVIGTSYERIREINCLENSPTLSRFYSLCSLYFAAPQELIVPSSTEIQTDEENYNILKSASLPDTSQPPTPITEIHAENFVPPLSTNLPAGAVNRPESSRKPIDTKKQKTDGSLYPLSVKDHLQPQSIEDSNGDNTSSNEKEIPIVAENKNKGPTTEDVKPDDTPPDAIRSSPVLDSAKTSKLVDYSKCLAVLPYLRPEVIAKLTPVDSEEYIQELNDDDEEELYEGEIDDFPIVETGQREGKVHFFLRVPQSHFRNGRSDGTSDVTYQTLAKSSSGQLRKTSNTSLNRRVARRMSTGSGMSDGTDLTPRRGFVAPFPRPMSRESSETKLELLLNNGLHSFKGDKGPSPAGTPERGGKNTQNFQWGHASSEEELEKIPHRRAQRRSSFVAGSKIEHFDGSRSTRPRASNSSADASIDYGYGDYQHTKPSSSDEEKPRRRANRRSSFVAGSKIERFDKKSSRRQMRRASMSTTSSSDFTDRSSLSRKQNSRASNASASSGEYMDYNDSYNDNL